MEFVLVKDRFNKNMKSMAGGIKEDEMGATCSAPGMQVISKVF
jgi:hypothetical protein